MLALVHVTKVLRNNKITIKKQCLGGAWKTGTVRGHETVIGGLVFRFNFIDCADEHLVWSFPLTRGHCSGVHILY